MPDALRAYVRGIDAMNRAIGRCAMYLLFALVGVLLWSSVSKTFFTPTLWTLETAQFIMVGYYILGGPYAMQMGSNVRMDFFYGDWSPRRKAMADVITIWFLMFYLGVLLYGAISSTAYSLGYFGTEPFSFFADLARAVFAAMARPENISYVPTPEAIRDKYQYFTEAPMARLRAAGYDKPFTELEEGVARYVKDFLTHPDPYC